LIIFCQLYTSIQIRANKTKEEYFKTVLDTINKYLPGIVCWGDSLTAGAGGNDVIYPNVLQKLIEENIFNDFNSKNLENTEYNCFGDISVLNMGVGGENTLTILGRNGAIPFVIKENIAIQADFTPVKLKISSSAKNEDGSWKDITPLRQGSRGIDYVIIDGIKGTLSIEQESYRSPQYTYWFVRKNEGNKVDVNAGTEIITSGSEQNLNYVPIIFIGQNGRYDDIQDLIKQQKSIIEHQKEILLMTMENQDSLLLVFIQVHLRIEQN